MTTDEELLSRARAEHPAWVEDAVFLEHVATVALVEDRGSLHAGDLYLACACARGVTEAIAVVESAHFARIREFVAGVETAPEQVAEIAQQLRTKLLVGDTPRIASYSGRGSLGGWIRVAAVGDGSN